MARRILGLALVLATMGAPLTPALCRVECADAAGRADHTVRHACHESNDPAALALTATPHVCGHADDALAGVEATAAVAASPAIVPPFAWSTPPRPDVRAAVRAAAGVSPPLAQRLTPLRV